MNFKGYSIETILHFAAKHGEVKVSSFRKIFDYYDPAHSKRCLDLMVYEGLLTCSKPMQVYIYKITPKGAAQLVE